MSPNRLLHSRSARWAAPVGVVVVVAGAIAVTSAAAGAAPALPARTAADLLVAVGGAHPQPFSGTVVETASLGLPSLPSSASTSSWTDLLSGSHSMRIWVASAHQVRLALIGETDESDVILNGSTVWTWNSATNTVGKETLPPRREKSPAAAPSAAASPLDPRVAAQEVLAALDPTTAVRVDGTARVAGRPVYELVLAPRDAASLIGQVRIALDAGTWMPLRVQVFARGASAPAFDTGFVTLSYATPPGSVFTFTPPRGATVTSGVAGMPSVLRHGTPAVAPAGARSTRTAGAQPTVVGSGWTSVAVLHGVSLSDLGGSGGGGTLAEVNQAAVPVQGSFGSGRLLTTALVNVLALNDGRVLIGAVTPQRLEQVAAAPAATTR